jgi:hypothetical protein
MEPFKNSEVKYNKRHNLSNQLDTAKKDPMGEGHIKSLEQEKKG